MRNTQIETVQRLIANSKADYAERLDAINAQIDKQIGEINVQKQASLETSGSQALLIPGLQEKKSALVIKSNELRKTYREKVEKVQVYQLTAIVCGTLEEWCFKDSSFADWKREFYALRREVLMLQIFLKKKSNLFRHCGLGLQRLLSPQWGHFLRLFHSYCLKTGKLEPNVVAGQAK